MPLIIAALWGALLSLVGTLVGRVLVSLGIGYVTYSGINASIAWAKAAFLAGLTGLPAAAVGLAGVMQVGTCVSMLLSAVTARMVLAGMSSAGGVKKMVVK